MAGVPSTVSPTGVLAGSRTLPVTADTRRPGRGSTKAVRRAVATVAGSVTETPWRVPAATTVTASCLELLVNRTRPTPAVPVSAATAATSVKRSSRCPRLRRRRPALLRPMLNAARWPGRRAAPAPSRMNGIVAHLHHQPSGGQPTPRARSTAGRRLPGLWTSHRRPHRSRGVALDHRFSLGGRPDGVALGLARRSGPGSRLASSRSGHRWSVL
jgi:hypothetical protein